MKNPTRWLKYWKKFIVSCIQNSRQGGTQRTTISKSMMSARAQVLSISLSSHGCPSTLGAVVVRDASSQRDSSQRTSSLFTSSKAVIFSSVVLSLKGNLFFPPKAPLGLVMSRNQSHYCFKINPQKGG